MGSDKKQEEIHAVSLHTGALIKTYRLFVSLTGDWESISLGPCTSSSNSKTCIYIQNAGDNAAQNCSSRKCTGGRENLYIYKFPEPDISQVDKYDGTRLKVVTLRYNYSHSSWPTNQADSEAIFVDWTGDKGGGKRGDIYIMTKQPYNRQDQRIGKIPVEMHEKLVPITDSKSANYYIEVKAVSKASVEVPWTDAYMSRDGKLVAARRESRVYFFPRDISSGQTISDAMKKPPCDFFSKTDMSSNDKLQSESVSFMGSTYFIEASECSEKLPCTVPVPKYRLVFD